MKINEFVEMLEERQLITSKVAQQVREKVAKGDRKITSKSLLKYLVKKEIITRSQAKQVLETSLTVTAAAESSILGMQALTPEKPVKKKKKPPKPEEPEEIPTLSPVGEDAGFADETDLSALGGMDEGGVSAEAGDELGDGDDDGKGKKGRKKKGKKSKRKGENEFDTPLLLFGGGGLLALILAGVIIGYLLTREDADFILEEASGYFEGQSYTQAIKQYEKFVEDFPNHPEFSTARVRLGMAKIWKASSSTTQYSIALKTTEDVLDAIEDEEAFETAKSDLSTLLPQIAEGLAAQAERESDPEKIATLVKESQKALAMCANTKFVPTTYRDEVRIDSILETIDRVQRQQEQRGKLGEALSQIQAAIDAQDTAKAYAIHKQLLKDYPGLLGNEELEEKVRTISAAEQQVVKFVEAAQPAETSEHPTELLAELSLAVRQGKASGVNGVAAVRVAGAVYGLDTNDGKLLWRKHVGRAAASPVVGLADGNFLVVDDTRNELLRLQADNGKLVWRQAFESPIVPPVVQGDKLLVTEKSGKLHLVDSNSGERLGYVAFGQPLPVAPAVNERKGLAYLLGEHSSLFTLRLEDLSCSGVHFVGHERGSISVPPAVALAKVLVAVNSGRDTSRLHVFSTDNDGVVDAEDTSKRLEGLVTTSLLVDGRRLVALTSRGQITVYEVGSGAGKDAITKLAERESESGRSAARFGLVVDGFIWSAGKRLNKYSVLPTGKRLPPQDTELDYAGDIFDYPLQTSGNILIHLRHGKNAAGSTVAAMNSETGAALWETELGVPLAGAPVVDSSGPRITAVTASGAAYVLDRNAMRSRVQDEAERLPGSGSQPPLTESVDLGAGRLVLGAPGQTKMLHFAPGGTLNELELPKPLACPLVAWGDAFVAPTNVGQVYLYDGDSGEKLGSPFQPELSSAASFSWLTPTVYSSGNESLLVITDGKQNIYLLRRSTNPRPNIEAVTEAPISGLPLETRLAAVGDAVLAGNQGGQLSRYSLPDLEPQEPIDVGGSVVWGPYAAGEQVLLSTGRGEMVSVAADGQVLWKQPLNYGPPQGAPLATDDGMFVTWQKGGVSRIDPASGDFGEAIQLQQPAVTGPVAFGPRLLLAAPDGTLLILDRP